MVKARLDKGLGCFLTLRYTALRSDIWPAQTPARTPQRPCGRWRRRSGAAQRVERAIRSRRKRRKAVYYCSHKARRRGLTWKRHTTVSTPRGSYSLPTESARLSRQNWSVHFMVILLIQIVLQKPRKKLKSILRTI